MGTEQASQSSKCGRSVVASPRETGLYLSTVYQHDDGMDAQTHWQNIYGMKAQDAVSWYRPHLEKSLELIEQAAHGPSTSIIDVGGGESTLVDDLIARGYGNITILDISQTAIDVTKKRLEPASKNIHWLVADITSTELEPCSYDVWHDRALFHFLTATDARMAYVRQVAKAR